MYSDWTRTEKLTFCGLIVAVIGVGVAILTVPEFRQMLGLNPSSTNVSTETFNSSVVSEPSKPQTSKSASLVGVKTVPKGEIFGGAENGLQYKNFNNTLEFGVAYKYANNNRVYIYDGQLLRPMASEQTFFRLYGCSGRMRIIDCAPVYEMPTSVTSKMLQGEIVR